MLSEGLTGGWVVPQFENPKVTPAMAAGITDTLWSVEDIAERIEARNAKLAKRGPYKKRVVA